MEYFHSEGGNNNPSFAYGFTLKRMSSEAYDWCVAYPAPGYFQRFHVRWRQQTEGYDIVQFESRKAAYLFSIAYSELILENKSIYSLAGE